MRVAQGECTEPKRYDTRRRRGSEGVNNATSWIKYKGKPLWQVCLVWHRPTFAGQTGKRCPVTALRAVTFARRCRWCRSQEESNKKDRRNGGLFCWLPLLGLNNATMFRFAQLQVCLAVKDRILQAKTDKRCSSAASCTIMKSWPVQVGQEKTKRKTRH